jgi:ketosteroid isomerase-like protein
MSAESNAQIIRDIYDAFTRGDVPAILERLSDDVSWGIPAMSSTEVPWHGVRHGKAGAIAFFQALGENCEFPRFEYGEIVADNGMVYAQVHFDIVIKKNGKRASADGIHCFTVQGGKVTRWYGTEDTAYTKALWNA